VRPLDGHHRGHTQNWLHIPLLELGILLRLARTRIGGVLCCAR
jgi:hypothetical protein